MTEEWGSEVLDGRHFSSCFGHVRGGALVCAVLRGEVESGAHSTGMPIFFGTSRGIHRATTMHIMQPLCIQPVHVRSITYAVCHEFFFFLYLPSHTSSYGKLSSCCTYRVLWFWDRTWMDACGWNAGRNGRSA